MNKVLRMEQKARMLYAELLLHYTLSERYRLQPEQRRIQYEPLGKPYLPAVADESVHFNVAHSGCWAACAFDRKPIGIDVETLRMDFGKLGPLFMSPREQEEFMKRCVGTTRGQGEQGGAYGRSVADAHSSAAAHYALRRWTLKESVVKAAGFGLSQPLYRLEPLLVGDGDYTVLLRGWEYRMRLYRLAADSWLSVCRSADADRGKRSCNLMRGQPKLGQVEDLPLEVIRMETLVDWTIRHH